MNSILRPLALQEHKRILALNVPTLFQQDLEVLIQNGTIVDDERLPSTEYDAAIACISSLDEIAAEAYMISKSLAAKDSPLWICYSPEDNIDYTQAVESMVSMNFHSFEKIDLEEGWIAIWCTKS